MKRLALALALLLGVSAAHAQNGGTPGPGPFVLYGTPGSRQATAQDIIKALSGAVPTMNGTSYNQRLYVPTLMGTDYTNPALIVGSNGLPLVYGPNHITLPDNSLQINLGHPYGSRGLSVGASIWIGGGAAPGNIGLGSPPVGPTVDTWLSNPTTLSSYGAIDSVSVIAANTAEANHQVLVGVTILSTAPNVVNAPAGQTFNALACRQGEIVQVNTDPLLWAAVSGCPTPSKMNVIGWEVPNGAALTPPNTAPNQDPTNTAVFTIPATLTLTALAPTHPFTWNTLTFMGAAGTAPGMATGWEHDSVCQSSAPCAMDGADLFSNFGQSQTALNIDGLITGGWTVGAHIAHVHYAGLQIDLSDENIADTPAVTSILLDKKYGDFLIARTGGVPTWGEDNAGNSTHSCPAGVTSNCGTGTFAGLVSATGLHEIATALDPYPILLQQNGVNLLEVDAAGDLHNSGATQTDGQTSTAAVRLLPITFANLGACTSALSGMLHWITDAVSVTYRGAATTGGGSLGSLVACNGVTWEFH